MVQEPTVFSSLTCCGLKSLGLVDSHTVGAIFSGRPTGVKKQGTL